MALPLTSLRRHCVVPVSLEGQPVGVLFKTGVRSPLQVDDISRASDVGEVGAFRVVVGGRELHLHPAGDAFEDSQTHSRWDITGRAVAGPLSGAQLAPVRHDVQFWFAAAAFDPRVRLLAA